MGRFAVGRISGTDLELWGESFLEGSAAMKQLDALQECYQRGFFPLMNPANELSTRRTRIFSGNHPFIPESVVWLNLLIQIDLYQNGIWTMGSNPDRSTCYTMDNCREKLKNLWGGTSWETWNFVNIDLVQVNGQSTQIKVELQSPGKLVLKTDGNHANFVCFWPVP